MYIEGGFRIYGPVDIKPLQQQVLTMSQEIWDEDKWRQKALGAQRESESIMLCWSGLCCKTWYQNKPEKNLRDFYSINQWNHKNYNLIKETLDPLLEQIHTYRPGGILRAILIRLDPSKQVYPHIDEDITFNFASRVHVPILSDGKTKFNSGGESFYPEEGVMFEIDNVRTHSVKNKGSSRRIHLVMDIYGDWPISDGIPPECPKCGGALEIQNSKSGIVLGCNTNSIPINK